jgi:hypothetical protein
VRVLRRGQKGKRPPSSSFGRTRIAGVLVFGVQARNVQIRQEERMTDMSRRRRNVLIQYPKHWDYELG